MNIFNIFRRRPRQDPAPMWPQIEYGSRGENIHYRLPTKEADIAFTWKDGARVYPDSIEKWADGSAMTEEEKAIVFRDVLAWLNTPRQKPIVVINTDDPMKHLWEQLCASNQPSMERLEYTSDEENYQFERKMYLGFLNAGKGRLVINDIEVKTEQDLDNALQYQRKMRNH